MCSSSPHFLLGTSFLSSFSPDIYVRTILAWLVLFILQTCCTHPPLLFWVLQIFYQSKYNMQLLFLQLNCVFILQFLIQKLIRVQMMNPWQGKELNVLNVLAKKVLKVVYFSVYSNNTIHTIILMNTRSNINESLKIDGQ